MPEISLVDLHLTDAGDRMCAYETDDVQIMRVRLAAGEALPHHNSNSNVLLMPLTGSVTLVTGGESWTAGAGSAISVPFDTPMDVSAGDSPVTFLVIKTPHPKNMK
ncbi:MAG: hypothetical protein KBI47_19345 [Armatimonadetes bacterium]|nr:hypothetical protein [Armatimonadota bacterium]MDI9584502.1 hypothetical protein [Acidobacteriota bacterium]